MRVHAGLWAMMDEQLGSCQSAVGDRIVDGAGHDSLKPTKVETASLRGDFHQQYCRRCCFGENTPMDFMAVTLPYRDLVVAIAVPFPAFWFVVVPDSCANGPAELVCNSTSC